MRTYVDIPEELLEDVEIFRRVKRCKSRAEAWRRLTEAGAEQFRAQRPELFQEKA